MAFNPEKHLTDIKGKKYLDVKWRIVWFREENPKGRLETEIFTVGDMIVARGIVMDADGVILASGSATVREAKQTEATWSGRIIEKAETAALGRALAHAGFGTQFTGEDDETDGNLADSPVKKSSPAKEQQRKSADAPDTKPNEDWFESVAALCLPFYNDPKHRDNGLNKALKESTIKTDMSANAAAATMLAHRAYGAFKMKKEDVSKALGGSASEWLKANNYDFAKAWSVLKNTGANSSESPASQEADEYKDIPF